MKDSFWDTYYPPNGWNCRCTVVQVLKDKYPVTDHSEAMRRGGEALAKDKKGMFAFNPGKGKTFPDYNPYTLSKCRTCTRKLNLAKEASDNQVCTVCDVTGNKAAYDITRLLKSLHDKKGEEYIYTFRDIINLRLFKPVDDVEGVYSALGKTNPDYPNILKVAKTMAAKGYHVFILPNPNSTQSGDCILQKEINVGLYDVKTITGLNSIGNRLIESVGQPHRVILNITSQYNPKSIDREIQSYFDYNIDALEVKVLKGKKGLTVIRRSALNKGFEKDFVKKYK